MVIRPKPFNLLIFLICLVVFIKINYKYFSLYSFLNISFQARKIEDIWGYKLNLTSKFIPITEKEKNLFSKLKSIQVPESLDHI